MSINNRFDNPDHEITCSCGLKGHIFYADDRPGGEGYVSARPGWVFSIGDKPGWNCGKGGHYQASYRALPVIGGEVVQP